MAERRADGSVFISYARPDASFVERLVTDLASHGIRVWWDRNLTAGEDWGEATAEARAAASVVLFVVSRAFAETDRAVREALEAERSGTVAIPLIVGESDWSVLHRLPLELGQRQGVDFSGNYNAGLRGLLEALPAYTQSAAAVEPLPQKSKGYAFLSYSEEDAGFVQDTLRPLLAIHGLTFWEYRSADRRYDTSIARELEERIDNAAAVVAVLSPDWRASAWAERRAPVRRSCRAAAFPRPRQANAPLHPHGRQARHRLHERRGSRGTATRRGAAEGGSVTTPWERIRLAERPVRASIVRGQT